MRNNTFAAVTGLVTAIFCSAAADTHEAYNALTENVLRLHILANSDSEYDQSLKLAVRDGLISRSEEFFGDCGSRGEFFSGAAEKLGDIENTAREILAENGCYMNVTAELAETHFDARRYGEITMPEGDYTALRVTIGNGEGHNWWCVMYPPLCLPCFSDSRSTDEILEDCEDIIPEKSADILKDPDDIEIKLYCAELIEKLKKLFSENR